MNRGTAFITGAGRGIGRACALELARNSYDIAIGYHTNRQAAEETLTDVRELGRDGCCIALDVRDEHRCATAVMEVASTLGPVRSLVSNATGLSDKPPDTFGARALERPAGEFENMYRARVLALLTMVRAALPDLRDGGSVVAITSTGTVRWVPGYSAIAAAMAATETLVRYLAVDLGPDRVRVNCVSAGVVRTDALAQLTDDVERLIAATARNTPLGRVGAPADVAAAVGWLTSEAAGWITGQRLVLDGGHGLR